MRKLQFRPCGNFKERYEDELTIFETDFGRLWLVIGLLFLFTAVPVISGPYTLYIFNMIGIAAIAAGHFALMCTFTGQYLVGALAVAVMAACLGFLVYNWNPATIFMGDSGSLFLGFTLAAIGIKMRFPENVSFVTWMIPLLVLGVPIFDTSLVIISRLRRGLNPLTTPGRDHSSHRLTYAGLTRREAVLVLYIAAFSLGLVALFITEATVLQSYVMGSGVALFALYALWRMEHAPFAPPPQEK